MSYRPAALATRGRVFGRPAASLLGDVVSSPARRLRKDPLQSDLKRGLRLLVGVRFQVCFTPLVGVLFTFPSRYWFAIGRQGVLRLGGWSPHVQTGFHVPRPTPTASRLTTTGLSPALARLSSRFVFLRGTAWSAFARRYWRSLG